MDVTGGGGGGGGCGKVREGNMKNGSGAVDT